MGPRRLASSTTALLVMMRPSLLATKPTPTRFSHPSLPFTATGTLAVMRTSPVPYLSAICPGVSLAGPGESSCGRN